MSSPPAVPDCRAPFDRPFLELAVAGEANWLVTGDRDLRALAGTFAVPIITPAELKIRLHAPSTTALLPPPA